MRIGLIAIGILFSSAAFAASPIDVSVQSHGGTAPRGAQRIPLLTLQIDMPCGEEDAVLSSLTVEHTGAGDTTDFRGVYALQEGKRISRVARTFRENTTVIRTAPLHLAACTMTALNIVGDFSASAQAAGEHVFSVSALTAGTRTFVIHTEARNTTAVSGGQAQGTIHVEFLPLLRPVIYGSARSVARLRLTAKERDQQVHSITLSNDGSARDVDLQSLFLRTTRGQSVTNVAVSLIGDAVALSFTPPLVLRRNAVHVWELIADVRASRRRTIRFTLDEPSDLVASPCSGKRSCIEAH